jgi:hypothetical protein
VPGDGAGQPGLGANVKKNIYDKKLRNGVHCSLFIFHYSLSIIH